MKRLFKFKVLAFENRMLKQSVSQSIGSKPVSMPDWWQWIVQVELLGSWFVPLHKNLQFF